MYVSCVYQSSYIVCIYVYIRYIIRWMDKYSLNILKITLDNFRYTLDSKIYIYVRYKSM